MGSLGTDLEAVNTAELANEITVIYSRMGIQSESIRIRPEVFAGTFGKVAFLGVVMLVEERKLETAVDHNRVYVMWKRMCLK